MRVENHGAAITRTDYWSSPHAAHGLLYLSVNAGALRLLLPAAALPMLAEVPAVGTPVAIRREGGRYLIAWDDGDPDGPYVLEIDERQADRRLPASDRGRTLPLVWYVPDGTDGVREARRETAVLT